MIRRYLSATLVLTGALLFAVPSASASSIFFSWDAGDSEFGFGPTFSVGNGSDVDLSNLFVELTLVDPASELNVSSRCATCLDLLTFVGPDQAGAYLPSAFIPRGSSVQTTADLLGIGITNAYLRWAGGTVLLFDPSDLTSQLTGGLTIEGTSAEVQLASTPAPVPEPGTLLLLGTGVAAVLITRRKQRAQ
jgi:hypothetical protein